MKLDYFLITALVALLVLALAAWELRAVPLQHAFGAMAAAIAPPAPAAVLSQLRVRALAGNEVELMIYGQIGDDFWGDAITAASVVEQLRGINASTIIVRINSIGGQVDEGLAIYNALKAHAARIVVLIDGQACSIASLIAMAGDEVIMPANTLMMLHAPMSITVGNSVDLRERADVLDQHAEAMATSYATKTGRPVAEILALLADGKDHWFTASQAVDYGLSDRVLEAADPATTDNTAAAAALLGYCASITRAPTQVSAALRRRISAVCTPSLFASIPEAAQLAVLANLEDSTMKQKYLSMMVAAAASAAIGNVAAVDIPAPAITAAGAAPGVDSVLAAAAVGQIRDRNERIRASLHEVMAVPGISALYTEALHDPAMSIESVQARAMTLLGASAVPGNGGAGRVQGGEDQRDKFITGATNAILARGNMEPREAGNEYNGMTLAGLAAESLNRIGISARGLSPDQISRRVLASQSSSDFPLLLSSVAGRALRTAYGAHPQTFRQFCAIGSVSDFKAAPRIQLGSFNSLATILEGGEFTYGSLSEEGESITAVTKGKALKLTRQMIVNDDLGGFLRRASLMGRAAARTVNNDVYTLLCSGGSNLGPTMSDGGQLFNATAASTAGGHANYLASGAAPNVAGISAGRAAMRKQKDAGLKEVLNIQPRFLIVPTVLEDAAWAILNSTSDPASANSNKANYVRDVANLTLISDPYLDTISATAWILAADPMDAPLIEVDFLDGIETPFIDEQIDFDTDSVKLKVRLDYGMAAIDWRGGYRNNGA